MTKSLPKWATRVIAAVLLGADYVAHHVGLIPPGATWHGINVMGALNELVLVAGMVGISGPALWPGLATFLGNPPSTPAPAPAPAQKP